MKKSILLFLFLAVWSTSSTAAIKVCTGPNREKSYSSMECPPGYHLQDTLPETEGSSPSLSETPVNRDQTAEPSICRNADDIYSYDIDDALREAERNLSKYRKELNLSKAHYWEKCVTRIKTRKESLARGKRSSKDSWF
jgi:hypothetical protein